MHAGPGGRRLRAARKLPGDAIAYASTATPVDLHRGGVAFEVPDGSYGSLPAWRSSGAWLLALRLHPRLEEACTGRVKPALFLAIMAKLAEHADPTNGRGIAVVHSRVATSLEISTKTVQRAVRIAYSLGALHLVLAGCQMSLTQRMRVLDRFGKGMPQRRWRELPNYYAATMPPEVVALLATPKPSPAVDNWRPRVLQPGDEACSPQTIVHPPEGGQPTRLSSVALYESSLSRGPVDSAIARRERGEGQRKTAAARPTEKRIEKSRVRGRPTLEPELEAYAIALRRRLAGFSGVSLFRIGPALRRYLNGGLSVPQLAAGLDAYLAATGITWISQWEPEHGQEQARYLVGMLTRARLAGFIAPRG